MRFLVEKIPSCRFSADINTGHAFGILMAFVRVLRTFVSTAPLALGLSL